MIDTLPKPDYETDDVRMYCADCLEILPQLPDGSVDAVKRIEKAYEDQALFAGCG